EPARRAPGDPPSRSAPLAASCPVPQQDACPPPTSPALPGQERDRSQRPARAPTDLHRERDPPPPRSGDLAEVGEIRQTRHLRRQRDAVHHEILRGAVVDRRGVDAEGADLPLADEQLRRLLAVGGEVEVRRVLWGVVTEVTPPVGPALPPSGA